MTRGPRHDPAGVLVELRPPGGWYQPSPPLAPDTTPTTDASPSGAPSIDDTPSPAPTADDTPSAPPAATAGEWDWRKHGNCLGVDPDLFFPERGASTREAKAVCQGCAVRDECLEHALSRPEKFGIWGGLSERERRRIRRARRLARQAAAEGTAS
jgi:WhiB family redox-sensing transcriptional regulator